MTFIFLFWRKKKNSNTYEPHLRGGGHSDFGDDLVNQWLDSYQIFMDVNKLGHVKNSLDLVTLT